MSGIKSSIIDTIGGTPLVRLGRLDHGLPGRVVAKMESHNPMGSVKDRIGANMLLAAEKAGKVAPGDTIVEPTSGNTGIGLALVSAVKGYRCVLVMPDTMSPERRVTLRAFGARLVLTEGAKGMPGAIERANQICAELPDAFTVDDVPVESPDLELHLVGMRGTVHPGYTDWACLLECRERGGCHATVEVRVEYRSDGVPNRLVIGGRIDGEAGEIMRVGRAQRPPVAVDGIDSVDVTVLHVHTDDEKEEELELDL